MAKKKKRLIPDDVIAQYEKIVSVIPDTPIKGAASAYTSLNGHMFSFVDKESIMSLRLPKEEREKFLKKYNSKLSEQYGSIMREYVLVPKDLFDNTRTMRRYFKISYAYVSSLKPK